MRSDIHIAATVSQPIQYHSEKKIIFQTEEAIETSFILHSRNVLRQFQSTYKNIEIIVESIAITLSENNHLALFQPDIHAGNCWPFKGSSGRIAIKLASEIHITSVSYQHIPPSISPSGHLSSAPKSFLVYGLTFETDDPGYFLGTFVYDIYAEDFVALQTFKINYEDAADKEKRFGMVSFVINDNYGSENFTCLYRFRVHGRA